MRKIERTASIILMFCMVLISGALLYASIFASTPATQSTLGDVTFGGLSGIRYNSATKDFDVFSAAGISWINSGRSISVDGTVSPSGNHPVGTNWARAEGAITYNIMCDIAYPTSDVITSLGADFNTSFLTTKLTIPTGAVLNGRGFYLKGFPVAGSIATALVAVNNGTIRNLVMTDVNVSTGQGEAVGMICASNAGIIENCTVYGAGTSNSYVSGSYTAMYGIAAENSGTITNCTNNANITNTAIKSYAAGIAAGKVNSVFTSNINNGTINAPASMTNVAGITIISNDYAIMVRGNKNNNRISGENSASGIVGGTVALKNLTSVGNINNGVLSAANIYTIFRAPGDRVFEVPMSGIRWNAEPQPELEVEGYFEVYSTLGFSYISSGRYITEVGATSEVEPEFGGEGEEYAFAIADENAYYMIMKDITYDATAEFEVDFHNTLPIIGASGKVEGDNVKLIDFPVRKHSQTISAGGTSYTSYSALFGKNDGEISGISLIATATYTDLPTNTAMGGIAAVSTGTIKNCSFSGSLDATGALSFSTTVGSTTTHTIGAVISVGGIVGIGGGVINSCSNEGKIRGNYYVGGIVGQMLNGSVERSTNTANHQIASWPSGGGGIIGGITGSDVSVKECINYGTIVAERTAPFEYSYSTKNTVGGIVGRGHFASGGKYYFESCINYGDFKWNMGQVLRAGVLAASRDVSVLELKFYNCENYGDFSATAGYTNAAGILGYAYGAVSGGGAMEYSRCLNFGNLQARNGTGGIVGDSIPSVLISECVNYGEIRSSLTGAGGLGGRFASATSSYTIRNSSNYGLVTYIPSYPGIPIGGAVGDSRAILTITNFTNHGDVISDWTLAGGGCRSGAFVGLAAYTSFVPVEPDPDGGESVEDPEPYASYEWHTFENCINYGSIDGETGLAATRIGNLRGENDLPVGDANTYNDKGNYSLLPFEMPPPKEDDEPEPIV